ncbi:MAG: regulatory signaling modulator protein AmpE [Panacagrimonas sp.]
MALIAILTALMLERLLGTQAWWSQTALLQRYVETLREMIKLRFVWSSAIIVPLIVLPPLLAVYWLNKNIQHPVLQLSFAGLLLLLCLGPRDLADDVKAWIRARERGDVDGAERIARSLQRVPETDESHVPDRRGLLGALFIQSHERLFGVLLWFFAFGAIGAVLYRLVSRLPRLLHRYGDNGAARAADNLHGLLAWIPTRVTAALFGLAGSLDDALNQWRHLEFDSQHNWRDRSWAVLAETASGSLEFETGDSGPELPATLELAAREVLHLQTRALLILLALFAIFTTGDWLG